MAIEPALLLERMASTLRHEVAPAVGDEFARTQAFMAAVILAKLSAQLGAPAGDDEHGTVAGDARAAAGGMPQRLAAALDILAADGSTGAWNEVVRALYATRAELGEETFERTLGVVRRALRARLDRTLRYAR